MSLADEERSNLAMAINVKRLLITATNTLLSFTVLLLFSPQILPSHATGEGQSGVKGLFYEDPYGKGRQLTDEEILNNYSTLSDEFVKLSSDLQALILKQVECAEKNDAKGLDAIDDKLWNLYDKVDANLLESRMVADKMKSPDLIRGSAEAAEFSKSSKMNAYLSSAVFNLCFARPAKAANRSRLALLIAEANPMDKNKIPELLTRLGQAYYWCGDYANAERCLSRAIELDGKNYEALLRAGQVAAANGQASQAVQYLDKVKTCLPDTRLGAHVDGLIAAMYAFDGKPEQAFNYAVLARKKLEKGSKSGSQSFDPLADETLGIAAAISGDYTVAKDRLTAGLASLKQSPIKLGNWLEAAQTALWRSYCLRKLGDLHQANEDRAFALSFAEQAPHLRKVAAALDVLLGIQPTTLKEGVAEPVPRKWAVVIGISEFLDPKIPKLRYSGRDAQDMKNFLVETAGFQSGNVKLLIDKDATKKAILDCLTTGALPSSVAPDDVLVVFVSSHGTPAYKDVGALNYLIAHDTDTDRLFSSAISLQSLVRLLQTNLKAKRTLVVLDTCYSGGLSVPSGSQSNTINPDVLVSANGRLVLCSCDENQQAWESKRYPNSVFTRHFVDVLNTRRKYSKFQEVFADIASKVYDEVYSDRHVPQNPKMAGNWSANELMSVDGTKWKRETDWNTDKRFSGSESP